MWQNAMVGFVAFCLVASGIYCLNDVRDADSDRIHPEKCRRPIASGKISSRTGIVVFLLLVCFGFASILLLPESKRTGALIVLVSYFLLNIAYSLKLKDYAIVDVFIIATGFVLRLVMGGVVCGIWLSPWIVCLTFLLALFLAFAKRRDDLVLSNNGENTIRRSSTSYNLQFLDLTLCLTAAITVVSYLMYTISPDVIARLNSPYLYVTTVFVLGGVIRYLQLTIVDNRSGNPTKLLFRDPFILLTVVCWSLSFLLIIYLF